MDTHAFALPADGKDYFQAGDFIFDIDDTRSGQGSDWFLFVEFQSIPVQGRFNAITG
ncbi:hypothetical protein [Chitinophaga polysaccharea]|uniref:hypothetical protein n=1 Tax=Chitinophaga polysaccharea TaxID=1293035 RepID=UPI00163C136A|nr:hypothetical protein [Chitinophaga polysaccharea]